MKRIKTSCKWLALACAIIIMLTGCGTDRTGTSQSFSAVDEAAAEKHQSQVFAMDTVMILTAYGSNGPAALAAAEEVIYALEADLDPTNPEGSIYAVNAGAGSYVPVSQDCIDVMLTAMEQFSATGGAVDPGLFPIIKAWGFTLGEYRVPESWELNGLLTDKFTEGVLVDEAAGAIYIPGGMEISLGAVGKGYTAQKALEAMADAGVESAILSLGGNVQTLGEVKPNGASWQVAVTDPHDTGAYVGILTIGEAAVVTSGGYQRYFEQDGVTYIHIIDPETGYPVDNDLLSVTVVTGDGGTADCLSTALFVMGAEGALEYYRTVGGFELVLITEENEVIVTPGLGEAFSGSGEGYTYEYLTE